jgi:hypothetical protein
MIQNQVRSSDARGDVSPLLRSIAFEVRERLRDIRDLESRQRLIECQSSPPSAKEMSDIAARLSVHRRELRMARRELERMGWIVEEMVPLRLVHIDLDRRDDATWQLTDTGFRRAGSG